ncbi:MAG: YggS family pyridoxal phosphate-dependent enzyme [Gammaproteobacteria bacterium]
MTDFSVRLQQLRERIRLACGRFSRDPAELRLLAVSKRHPASAIIEAMEAGQRDFGENFVQEGIAKIEALDGRTAKWHFIGHLQSNKTRQVATHFDWVQSVDRLRIARRLSEQRPHHAGKLQVCIQVRIGDEQGKAGVEPDQVSSLAEEMLRLPRLALRGLMAIPPPETEFDRQRQHFAKLRELYQRLQANGLPLDTLSMGMSDDLEAAVAEGSTMVRIGTALFGPRPDPAPTELESP